MFLSNSVVSTHFQTPCIATEKKVELFWTEITLLATDKGIKFTEASPLHTTFVLTT